jgi:hypothetical protein
MGSTCYALTYIDGIQFTEIGAGETAKFYLPAGERIIGINSPSLCGGGLKGRSLVMDSGATSMYRISIDSSMSMDLFPTVF